MQNAGIQAGRERLGNIEKKQSRFILSLDLRKKRGKQDGDELKGRKEKKNEKKVSGKMSCGGKQGSSGEEE